MTRKVIYWTTALFGILSAVGCVTKPIVQISNEKVIDSALPDRDIVFQLDPYHTGGSREIGFINADGSGLLYITRKNIASVAAPVWLDDGGLLLFSHPANFIEGIAHDGSRVTIKNIWARNPSPIHGENAILAETATEDERSAITRIDLKTGEIRRICIAEKEAGGGITLGTNSLYSQKLVYERWLRISNDNLHDEIVLLDTVTGKETIILENRFAMGTPAFSPDGTWIAYTAHDGIYLVRPDGSENHRIVTSYTGKIYDWPPRVSWSPDGDWIVYHRCILSSPAYCEDNVEDSWIFKYNIETGEEVLLVKGGVNPYWRWPTE